jgi:16S rRNA G966 N2-methylase RsmD
MQSNMQTTSGIHCKVQYGDVYRRFLYQSTQYAPLLAQIKRLFGFSDVEEVMLKYKDEEGDMVTVSSTEELVFAIELFTGSVLKLNVVTEKNTHKRPRRCQKGGECRPQRNGEFWRDRWHQKLLADPALLAQKIDRLTQKRDQLRNRLQSIKQNGPRPQNRWNPEKKLERVEHRLANLQSLTAKQNNPSSEPSQSPIPGSVEQNVVVVDPPTTKPLSHDELAANLTKAKYLREQQVIALADVKMKMQARKQDIQQIRAQAKAECIPKNEMQQRIAPLKEEMKTIRETLLQRKAELQACNQNISEVRKALMKH